MTVLLRCKRRSETAERPLMLVGVQAARAGLRRTAEPFFAILGLRQEPTINHHGMTNHETGCRAAKPYHGSGDLLGLSKAANRFGSHKGLDDVRIVVLRDPRRHRCVSDDPWADRIDANAFIRIIERSGACEAGHPKL